MWIQGQQAYFEDVRQETLEHLDAITEIRLLGQKWGVDEGNIQEWIADEMDYHFSVLSELRDDLNMGYYTGVDYEFSDDDEGLNAYSFILNSSVGSYDILGLKKGRGRNKPGGARNANRQGHRKGKQHQGRQKHQKAQRHGGKKRAPKRPRKPNNQNNAMVPCCVLATGAIILILIPEPGTSAAGCVLLGAALAGS